VIYPYICDFFCPAKGLIIEIDGDTHDAPHDERRDARLAGKGFATLRFTNHEVWDNLDGVIASIASALQERGDRWAGVSHPNPSPEGEGLVNAQEKPLPFGGGVGVGEANVALDEGRNQ
jgi:hypothetical protein